ncbi:uncharacterized protein LOC132171809 isoform X1 [Corylus avellana]|uniref:uncharacterized protein LOC132171809 isoform X1 n=1 Tax=Corylus avellana TaxID=13451 RepID=UPI00286C5476|nr:uncharacterized protein LOC132171809 isoform X1 [Corylus avellana]
MPSSGSSYGFSFRVWDFRRIEDLSDSRPHAPDEVPIQFRATEVLKIKKSIIGNDDRQVSVAQARSRTRSKTFWVPKRVALLCDGGARMLSLLSDVGAPAEHQEAVARDISSAAAARSVGMGTSPIAVTFQHTTLVVVDDVNDDDEEYDEMDMGLRESMAVDVARPIPATRSAIEGLKKVTFEEDGLRSIGECIICTEEFQGGLELTRLPCSHVYHGDCIVKWLEKSHRCPLCRYPLPYVRLIFGCPYSYIFIDPRSYKSSFKCIAKNSSSEAVAKSKHVAKNSSVEAFAKSKREGLYMTNVANGQALIPRSCLGGSLRGRGWKYGSGFVDEIFPVLSPIAQ